MLLLLLLIAGGGSALTFVPLFEVPGYELSLALALLLGTLGGGVGIGAGFLERRMIEGRDPRPAGALRYEAAAGSVLIASATALALLLLAALPPLLVAVSRSLVTTACDPFAHAGFVPLLLLPSALIAAGVGVFAALATSRRLTAGLLYGLLLLGSAVWTGWPLFFGPQVFAYNHFGGFFPGPLYDEALELGAPLAWFRLQTVLIAGFVAFFTAFCLDMRRGKLSRPHFRPVSLLTLGFLALGIFTLEERAPTFGFRMSETHLERQLDGYRETEHFQIYFWRGKPREDLERFVRDLEFRYAQISKFLGGAPTGRVAVYLYKTPQEKQALTGAGRTQFAKPWRLELHVNDAPFPHPALKHELAHVMGAPLGSGPFAITSKFSVIPHMAIIEGFAVAADDPVRENLTLHQWAAAMRRQKLAPDLRLLFRPEGFYSQAASRAYILAGSFLRFLADRHGTDKLRDLYSDGDLRRVYGEDPEALVTAWETSLDELPLDETAVNQAFGRFRQGSMFQRACAREVATLDQRADLTLLSDPEEALSLYTRCQQLQPDEPDFALGRAKALAALDRKAEAKSALDALAEKVKAQPVLTAEVLMARAQLSVDRALLDEARPDLTQVAALKVSPQLDRTSRVMLAGLDEEAVRDAVFGYFDAAHQDLVLLRLERALPGAPGAWSLNYLMGRRLETAGANTLAAAHLSWALEAETLPESVKLESHRLLLRARYRAGDCQGVRDASGRAPDLGPAFRAEAIEWVDRCAFEERALNGPLSPKEPFK